MYLIRERLLGLGDDFDITDESGRKVYHVDGKVLSLRDRLIIEDPTGREVASVHRQLVALRRTYTMRTRSAKKMTRSDRATGRGVVAHRASCQAP